MGLGQGEFKGEVRVNTIKIGYKKLSKTNKTTRNFKNKQINAY